MMAGKKGVNEKELDWQKLNDLIEVGFDQAKIARHLGMQKNLLSKKVKEATGYNLGQYIEVRDNDRQLKLLEMRKHLRSFQHLDLEAVELCCSYHMTLEEICSIFNTSDSTLSKRISEKYNLTFKEFRQRAMRNTKVKIIEAALKMGLVQNNPIIIKTLLKNWCGFEENPIPDKAYEYKTTTSIRRYGSDEEECYELTKERVDGLHDSRDRE